MRRSTTEAQQIVDQLSTADKIRIVSGRDFWTTEDLSEHSVPSITMTDGPHGLRKQPEDVDHVGIGRSVPATCFPPAVTLASTWDVDLIHHVGAAVGAEARDQDVSVVLGPGLNIKRHPAGGRNFEYYSEDPLVSGTIAAAAVRGIQSAGVGACLKHYAANNQEFNRNVLDTLVDDRTLREIYLTGFEIAVKEGKPWTVMGSYNRLNGEHTGESRTLLTDILRHEWGFDGLVMTDWSATYDRAVAISAGLDLEMPGSSGAWDAEVAEAIERGTLSMDALDAAAVNVVDLMIRARDHEGEPSDVSADYEAHHQLARTVAAAGTVLLTNDGTLPLQPTGTIAVIGAFATAPRHQGGGSSLVNPTRLDAPLAAITTFVGDDATLAYAPGYDVASGQTTDELVADAVAAATDADVAVVFAGLPPLHESEGYDRAHLRLPDGHNRLIEAVAAANPRTVVVLFNGSPVEMPWVGEPAAIVEAYLGGQAIGSAITDVLFGVVDPGGRLAETFPVRQEDVLADPHFTRAGRQVQYRERLNVGYRSGVTPLFAFGHGLSYTTFEMSDLTITPTDVDYQATVTVTNTGDRSGSTVVQLYTRYPDSTIDRPDLHLVGFAKVQLDAGASRTLTIPVTRRSLAVWDTVSQDWMVEAGECEFMAGFASDAIVARQRATIDSPDRLGAQFATATSVANDTEFAALLGHPTPPAEEVLPFHRDSTVEELRATLAGKVMYRIISRQITKAFAGSTAAAEMVSMINAITQQMPLRALASSSQGNVSLRRMDRLIRLLNAVSVKAWFAPTRR